MATGAHRCGTSGRDPRVDVVLDRIDAGLPQRRPSLATLAHSVSLSEDRLSHLFVETIGLPLRSYAVWRRYRRAIGSLASQIGLTELAVTVGFADAAHMTRTFNTFFGFSPSFLRRSGFAQMSARVN
ncbi:MAG: helix-turn-helix domain-containing protein [Paraburkholderia sp.]